MAKVLADYVFLNRRRGAPCRYEWDKWFDGQKWELKRVTDFGPKPESFRSMAVTTAKRRNIKLRVNVVDENTVVIQALKETVPCE